MSMIAWEPVTLLRDNLLVSSSVTRIDDQVALSRVEASLDEQLREITWTPQLYNISSLGDSQQRNFLFIYMYLWVCLSACLPLLLLSICATISVAGVFSLLHYITSKTLNVSRPTGTITILST